MMLTGKTGFEPATSGVTNQHSNRLSYFPGNGEFIKPPHPELICSLFNESHFVFFPVVNLIRWWAEPFSRNPLMVIILG